MRVKRSFRKLSRTFLTGLLAALPLVATLGVFAWMARLLYGWLGPDSLVGQIFVAMGLGLAGSTAAGYFIGLLIVAAVIFSLGLLVQARLQGSLARVVNALVGRIPLVRNVYDLIRKFVDLLAKREGDNGLTSMSPVWCRFGGEGGGVLVLGLLSTPHPVLLQGRAYHGVLVPTAPVPVGGGLLYVPAEWVTPAQVGMEAVTSIYVSMGVTSGQHLPRA